VRLPLQGVHLAGRLRLHAGQRTLPLARLRAKGERLLTHRAALQNSHLDGNNLTVWNQPLITPNGSTFFWNTGGMTCTGGYDTNFCSSAYSELANLPFCSITKPMRYTPLVQVGNPPYRPQNLAGVPGDDTTKNETWEAPQSGSFRTTTGNSFKAKYSRPSPFLYAAGTSNDALALANGMMFSPATIDATIQVITDLLTSVAVSRSKNFSDLQTALATPLATFAANPAGPIGDVQRMVEVIPLYSTKPIKPMLFGTSAVQPRGNLQRDTAFTYPLMLLLNDCTQLPAMYRGNLSYFGLTLFTDMNCVSMPALQQPSVAVIQNMVFSGYAKGPPGAVGTNSSYAQYPFAVDFGSTEASFGAVGKMASTLLYNGTLVAESGQPLAAFFRANGPLNRLTNAFISNALSTLDATINVRQPRATMLYVRDMPTQGLSIKLDVGTFLGPLFYTWLSQMLLPVIVGLLVYEKEKNLRTMMKIQGLGDTAYMLVNYMCVPCLRLRLGRAKRSR